MSHQNSGLVHIDIIIQANGHGMNGRTVTILSCSGLRGRRTQRGKIRGRHRGGDHDEETRGAEIG